MRERFDERWQRRQKPSTQQQTTAVTGLTVSEQIVINGVDPDRLWRLVWDPSTSPLVLDHVVSAFTLPGTPAGRVGEMQMHVVRGAQGTLIGMIEEVTELGPGYRAVTRSRSTTRPMTSTALLLPLEGRGCVLRQTIEVTAPVSEVEAVREETQAHQRRYLARVRDLAEASLRHRQTGPQ